jgi:hypothetical protein
MRHGLFISAPYDGFVYVAERSRYGTSRFLWWVMPHMPIAADMRIAAGAVPLAIRRQAYRHLSKLEQ